MNLLNVTKKARYRMQIQKALKILSRHNVQFNDYFDLVRVETTDHLLRVAIERVKTYITIGR